MNKKIIIFIFMIFNIVLLFTGCATKEQRAALKAVEEQATSNALEYIENKYGFEVSVVSAKAHKELGGLFPTHDPTGYATVTVKYNKVKFHVYITGEQVSTDGVDDYQKDIILEDFENVVKVALEDYGSDEMYIDFYCGIREHADKYTQIYYDGSNLWEALEDMGGTWGCRIFTKGLDMQSIDIETIFEELVPVSHLFIVNGYDLKEYEYLKEINFDYDLYDIKEYACYIDEYYYYSAYDNEYCDLDRVKEGSLYVVMPEGSDCEISSGMIIVPMDKKKISKAYTLETDAETIYVYIVESGLNSSNYSGMDILYNHTRDGEKISSGMALTRNVNSQHIMCVLDEIEEDDKITITAVIDR